jgi:hypothetical protein
MRDPITKDELVAACKGAMKYAHPKDDSEEARTVITQEALKLIKTLDGKMRDPANNNSGFDMARFWFAVGMFTADGRHGSQGESLIIIPTL